MVSRLTDVIIDCHDLERLSRFWCAVLGYEPSHRGEGWVALSPPAGGPPDDAWRDAPQAPAVALVVVPEDKTVKNRVHIDVTPAGITQDLEVARLEHLGATRIDIGQTGRAWVVMADPEGNEFCVMPGWDEP